MSIRWILAVLLLAASNAFSLAQDAIAPKEVIDLFNGKDLAGLTTWLKETQTRRSTQSVSRDRTASSTLPATASATSPPTRNTATIT